jgi:replicative DNA helicase
MLYSTGLKSLDELIGGGYAPGEVVVIAALTSHGKTMVGLQLAWAASNAGKSVLIVSEEMTVSVLAERAIETASERERSEWRDDIDAVFNDVIGWEDKHPGKILVPSVPCHSAARMLETVSQAVVHFGVKIVVVDYLQLITAPGANKYEQVTNVSIAAKQMATEHGVAVIALAQFNKQAEQETMPKMYQIADSSQIPKDADVVLICKWPWKSDHGFKDANEYWIACQKNRNRGIRGDGAIKLRFEPMRQRLTEQPLTERDNYTDFGEYAYEREGAF